MPFGWAYAQRVKYAARTLWIGGDSYAAANYQDSHPAVFASDFLCARKDIHGSRNSNEVGVWRRNMRSDVLVYDLNGMSCILDNAGNRQKPEMRRHPRL